MKKYILCLVFASLLTISFAVATDYSDDLVPNKVVKVSNGSNANIVTDIFYTLHHKERGLPVTYDGKTPHDGSTLVLRDWNDYKPDGQWRNSTLFAIEPSSDPSYYTLFHKERGLPVTYDGKTPHDGSTLVLRDWNDYKLDGQWRNSTLFSFIPTDYKLSAHLSDFDFGNYEAVSSILSSNKKLAFAAVENITVSDKDLNSHIGSEYGESINEAFSWGLNQKLGISVKTTVKSGIPFLAEGKVEVGGSFEFGANENWSISRVKSFKSTISMGPKEPGVYKLGKIVHVSENAQLPFTAKAKLFATRQSDNRNFSSVGVQSLFQYEGLSATINKIGTNYIEVTINGTLQATYGVWSENITKKVRSL